jgi:hypothetical protein
MTFKLDPHFCRVAQQFDESGAHGMLMNSLVLNNDIVYELVDHENKNLGVNQNFDFNEKINILSDI